VGLSLIKIHPDFDCYTVLSTVVMGAVLEGSREEIQSEESHITDEMFERADETGTSDPDGPSQEFTWNGGDYVFGFECVRDELPSFYALPSYGKVEAGAR
jgi:hypothetical protein